MITLNHAVRRKEGVSLEDFSAYWMGEHVRAARELAPLLGIRKHTKCETLHDDPATLQAQAMYNAGTDVHDFMDQMVIADLAAFKAGMEREEVREAAVSLHRKSGEYVDHSRSDYWFTIDLPQIFPREQMTATWDNQCLKSFYILQHLPNLSLTEAQLHWNSCHGSLARQFSSFLFLDKYIQAHRAPSDLLDAFKAMLGGGFENKQDLLLGQAESWFDRPVLSGPGGPEAEHMLKILVEDIALFIDSEKSAMFCTKEHVIHSERIITYPIPTLFKMI